MFKKLTIASAILFLCSAFVLYAGHNQLEPLETFESTPAEMSWEFGTTQSIRGCVVICDDGNCFICCPNPKGVYSCTPCACNLY